MSGQRHKPALYALLVAINDYAAPVPALNGCVNDLEKMATYLDSHAGGVKVSIKKIINGEATKAAIVSGFRDHLAQAEEKDIALFYYSGHGTQEEADPVFWPMEEDRKLQSLVCYDHTNLLADKELRYLIHAIAANQAHVVTIFDCCHSGGNTRNAYIGAAADTRERRYIVRDRLSGAFPIRKWAEFIFAEEIPYEAAKKTTAAELLPEGTHIQLAACENDQSAYETGGEGVFTRTLLEVLTRFGGNITYYDLQSQVQQYIRYQFDQTPRIYMGGDSDSGLFRGFLNREIESKPTYGNISYNARSGWIMDLGSMHGLSPKSPPITVRSADGQLALTAIVREVYPAYCCLDFKGTDPDPAASYRGQVTGYLRYPFSVYLHIPGNEDLRDKLTEKITAGESGIRTTGAGHEAAYAVQYVDGHLIITTPGAPDLPIIQPRKHQSDHDLDIIRNYLLQLSQFEFVKHLHNPDTYLFTQDPVALEILEQLADGTEETRPVKNGEVALSYLKQPNGTWGGHIRIRLKNRSDSKLYCALLYLSVNFGISTKLLKQGVVGIEPNREVWALDGAAIGLTLEEEVVQYHQKDSVSFLKLIISNGDFAMQASRFEMPPLPGPLESPSAGSKGLDLPDTFRPDSIADWTTRLITLKIKNPLLILAVFLQLQPVFQLLD